MPSYDFYCETCKVGSIVKISAEVVNKDPDWNKVNCVKCSTLMYIVFDRDSIPNFIFKGGEAPVGQQCKAKREAQRCAEIAEEPIQSQTELDVVKGVAAEEEKKRGMTPGTLTDGVKAPTTKAQKEKIAKRDLAKKEISRKARQKAGIKLNERGTKL